MRAYLWTMAAILAALLAGCGGGDATEDEIRGAGTQPVDCVAHPEQCQ